MTERYLLAIARKDPLSDVSDRGLPRLSVQQALPGKLTRLTPEAIPQTMPTPHSAP